MVQVCCWRAVGILLESGDRSGIRVDGNAGEGEGEGEINK